jgi:hypothetical protein
MINLSLAIFCFIKKEWGCDFLRDFLCVLY